MTFFESIYYMAWRGIAIGLIISAPMGPVGMLCIQRTLDKGRKAGLYTGIGAALSDLFYCLLTGFGLSFIEEFLERNSNIIQLVGSAVLIAFAIYLFRKNPTSRLKKPIKQEISAKKNILGGFLFTFSNPLILFLIVGLFARFNFLLPEFKLYQYLTGFVFIFVGALLWWWFITFSIAKVRSHFNIRSMWLINRIIGAIILLFAIVGIFTAVSALAQGARPARIQCWNEGRGFSEFSTRWDAFSPDGGATLANNGEDTVRILTSASPDCEFSFKVRNLRCSPGRKYEYITPEGKKRKVSMPPWGISIGGTDGGSLDIMMESAESHADMLGPKAALKISLVYDGKVIREEMFSEGDNSLVDKIKSSGGGPDPTGSLNFFRIGLEDGVMKLYGGLHSAPLLLQERLDGGFRPDGIGYVLYPGASIALSDIKLSLYEGAPDADDLSWSDLEALDSHLGASRDPMEGYWQILDRSLEETLLRLGGNYRFAMVKSRDGYLLLYISGAGVNSDRWIPGMPKARLTPSGIGGIWDVEWTDATFAPLSHEIKAQRDTDGILTIQFPYQSSTLRLSPTPGGVNGR